VEKLSEMDPIEVQSQMAKVPLLCTSFAFDLSHIFKNAAMHF
jgi:hypothetical protein